MFKYTKRFFSDIRFWTKELIIRERENAELERIENDYLSGISHHPMAGFNYYKEMQRNRMERKRLHQLERASIK